MIHEITFDVMLNDRFIRTLRTPFCPLFPIEEREFKRFVEQKLPTLKGKDYKIKI